MNICTNVMRKVPSCRSCVLIVARGTAGIDRHRLVRPESQHGRLARLEGGLDGELLPVVARLGVARLEREALAPGVQGVAVARFRLVVAGQGEEARRPARGQGDHSLEALDGAIGASVTGIEFAQSGLRGGIVRPFRGEPQALDELDALGDERCQARLEPLRLPIGGDRSRMASLRRVAHAEMDVSRGMARIERQHLLEPADCLAVILLAPGDVAELAEALDVAGLALEHAQGSPLVRGRDTQSELDRKSVV